MNLLNLDLYETQYKTLAIEAFTHVYGEKYRDIIEDKISSSIIMYYRDLEGIKSYLNKLKYIKSYQLALSFLKQIKEDITKYENKNNIELLNDTEFYMFCSKYFGSLYDCFEVGKNIPIKKHDPYNYNFIELINYMYKKEEITKENFEQFKETEDYKKILDKIKIYNQIYDELKKEYKIYESTLSTYQKYIDREEERKSKIYENGINRIIKRIYPLLPKFLQDKFNKSTKEEIKKILFGSLNNNNFTDELLLDFFNKENIEELYSSETRKYKKWIIADFQTSYFKKFDVNLPDKETLSFEKEEDVSIYLKFLEQENIKNLIPSQDVISKIHEICKEEANKCLEQYYIEREDFTTLLYLFNMDESYYDWLLDRIKNKKVCITFEGANVNGKYVSVMFYTIRNNDLGFLAHSYLHELGHVCDDNKNTSSGLEGDFDDESKNPYDNSRRKYEIINETINDIFTIEATNFLHSKNIYIFEKEENTNKDISDNNTHSLTKSILAPLLNSYREYVIETKINSDQSILSNYIGKKNFEVLNDIVNRVDYLSRQRLKYKIENNEECEEIIEYNVLLDRVKQVYINIEKYVANNLNENKAKSL